MGVLLAGAIVAEGVYLYRELGGKAKPAARAESGATGAQPPKQDGVAGIMARVQTFVSGVTRRDPGTKVDKMLTNLARAGIVVERMSMAGPTNAGDETLQAMRVDPEQMKALGEALQKIKVMGVIGTKNELLVVLNAADKVREVGVGGEFSVPVARGQVSFTCAGIDADRVHLRLVGSDIVVHLQIPQRAANQPPK